MDITSKELEMAQKSIERLIKKEIDSPMSNYDEIDNLLKTLKLVDNLRRETWNKEKFGAYDDMAKEAFCADDIPF